MDGPPLQPEWPTSVRVNVSSQVLSRHPCRYVRRLRQLRTLDAPLAFADAGKDACHQLKDVPGKVDHDRDSGHGRVGALGYAYHPPSGPGLPGPALPLVAHWATRPLSMSATTDR